MVSQQDSIELESGDSVLVSAVSDAVLLSLDDTDETEVPTARLTVAEARQLGSALIAASFRTDALEHLDAGR